ASTCRGVMAGGGRCRSAGGGASSGSVWDGSIVGYRPGVVGGCAGDPRARAHRSCSRKVGSSPWYGRSALTGTHETAARREGKGRSGRKPYDPLSQVIRT